MGTNSRRVTVTIVRTLRDHTEICLSTGFKFCLPNNEANRLGIKEGDHVHFHPPLDSGSPAYNARLIFTPPTELPATRIRGTVQLKNGVVMRIVYPDDEVRSVVIG